MDLLFDLLNDKKQFFELLSNLILIHAVFLFIIFNFLLNIKFIIIFSINIEF